MITTINEFRKYFESLDINKEYKLNKQTNKQNLAQKKVI